MLRNIDCQKIFVSVRKRELKPAFMEEEISMDLVVMGLSAGQAQLIGL